MKKFFLISFMLISLILFAADGMKESMTYECVEGWNTIALPLDAGFETMADVGEELQSATEFSKLDAPSQKWQSTAKSPYGVWVMDFAAEPGMPLMVKNNDAETFTLTGSPFFPEPTYQIYLGHNFIMAPLSRPDLTTSALLGNDLSNANQIGKWDSTNQEWIVSSKNMFGIWVNPFPISIGMPLIVRSTSSSPYTWPDANPDLQIDWGNGVTGLVETGVASNPLIHGVNGTCPYSEQFSGSVGYFFTLTLDDSLVPIDIRIRLDQAALGYAPGQIGWYLEGFGWSFMPSSWDYENPNPLQWNESGTENAWINMTISNSKKERADTDLIIAFSSGNDVPLPVVLSSFTANSINNVSILSWTTQSEINNLGWNIYQAYSEHLSSSAKINNQLIAGAGTTSEMTEYRFMDENSYQAGETIYYWLESIDYANNSLIHSPISLIIPESEETPSLSSFTNLSGNFPNPFNPVTTIHYNIKEGETGILQIFNAKGQMVQQVELNETPEDGAFYEFDAKYRNSGVYFYRLKTNSYSEVKKMILIK